MHNLTWIEVRHEDRLVLVAVDRAQRIPAGSMQASELADMIEARLGSGPGEPSTRSRLALRHASALRASPERTLTVRRRC